MGAKEKSEPPVAKRVFLVLWWQAQVPYSAVFDDEVQAYAAANVRNAVLLDTVGTDFRFEKIVDYYRRDKDGNPMPFEWRNVSGPSGWPWMPRPSGSA